MTDTDKYYADLKKKLEQKAKEGIKEALKKTWHDFFAAVEMDVQEIFKGTIQDFYADYSPGIYTRNESLYKLLKTETGPNGDYLKVWFEPSEMTAFRGGYNGEDGLYNQVFRLGWHGGAGSISNDKAEKYGAHPNPGEPYWRTPKPYYVHWGRAAETSSPPPLNDFRMRLDAYQSKEMREKFKAIWEQHKSDIKISL